MHTSDRLTEQRVARFIAERLAPGAVRDRAPLAVSASILPGEPISFDEAVRGAFVPVDIGFAWGAPWSTTWFHLAGTTPERWLDDGRTPEDTHVELFVDLGFSPAQPGFQAEGLAYRTDGSILRSIQPRQRSIPIPAGPVDIYLEAAGNPELLGSSMEFTPTRLGDRSTAPSDPLYVLLAAELTLVDETTWELLQDVRVLFDLILELPAESTRRARVLHALDTMLDAVDPHDVTGTAAAGRQALAGVLSDRANASAHQVYAVGHAHIDSAWLWPVRETVRKCARTFANQIALMDEHSDYRFVASSAQQYAWIEERYPDLFERIREKVAAGQFVPVGSMWVEPDTNMPGGESMVRQLLEGKSYFRSRFGIETTDVWLPDSFGYSGALPQLFRLAGCENFLSQKLSWNEMNRMPHHTFWWQGIDGSAVFTHFPPVDTYNAELSARELLHAEAEFREKRVASRSIVPFGWGDGGGGPTREMIASARRQADLEGLPAVRLASPDEFYADARAEYASPPRWVGEMYLEFHRGTYTSQARMKQGNRRSEHLLREAELWSASAAVAAGFEYPHDALERIWREVLLYQFHDILPGSSIGWVHREAEERYGALAEELEAIIAAAGRALVGEGDVPLLLNATPHDRDGVAALGARTPIVVTGTVALKNAGDGGLTINNGRIRVTLAADGTIVSLLDLRHDREVIPVGERANLLQLHLDTPRAWDAWDLDVEHRRHVTDLTALESMTADVVDGVATVRIHRVFGASQIEQTLTVSPDSPVVAIVNDIDWHERQKLLKLAFPVDLIAERSASETQFGHVFRPTHANTSWDATKFEICAHRWVRVEEAGYGVSLANSATYGHDVTAVPREDARPFTSMRMSLLRSALYPDPRADAGHHKLTAVLRVDASTTDAIRDGYDSNLPRRTITGAGPVNPIVMLDAPGVMIETVKLAADRSDDVIVRLYESLGGRGRGTIRAGFPALSVEAVDLLERPREEDAVTVSGDRATLALGPFQVVSLRFRRG